MTAPANSLSPAIIERATIAVWFSCGAASAVAAKQFELVFGENRS